MLTIPSQGASPRTLSGLGVAITLLTEGHEVGFSIMRYRAPAGFPGPRPHYHGRACEWFHVVDGAMSLLTGAGETILTPGDFATVAPGEVHSWRNASHEAPMEFLFGFDRPGMEGFFVELLDLAARSPVWPPADPAVIRAIEGRYDTTTA